MAINLTLSPLKHEDHDLIATYSGLGKFAACRRLWWFSEYLGLKPVKEEVTGPLPFGSRIHSALEAWRKELVAAPVDIWDDLMAIEYVHTSSMGWDSTKLDKESKMGHAMLAGFPEWMESQGWDARYKTISVETAMSDAIVVPTPLGNLKVLIRGKADEIVQRKVDGKYAILDWKTTSALADSVLTVLMKSPQTRIYALLAKKANPDLEFFGGLIVLLRKVMQTSTAKPPFYGELEIPLTKPDMVEYRHRLIGAVTELATAKAALDAGADHRQVAYFNPSRVTCISCPFRAPCDLMASYPAGAMDMLSDLYVQGNPFARYENDHIDEKEQDVVTI